MIHTKSLIRRLDSRALAADSQFGLGVDRGCLEATAQTPEVRLTLV